MVWPGNDKNGVEKRETKSGNARFRERKEMAMTAYKQERSWEWGKIWSTVNEKLTFIHSAITIKCVAFDRTVATATVLGSKENKPSPCSPGAYILVGQDN